MSHLLWKSFWNNDVERFRRLLAPGAASLRSSNIGREGATIGGGGLNASGGGSPGAFGTSPRVGANKSRKASAFGTGGAGAIGKAEINSRDHAGLTLLLRAASSDSDSSGAFVRALLEHPALDLYVQDPESGWNALHRALYAGNVSIARMLMAKESKDIAEGAFGSAISRIGQLIKTKDHEGNSPFDVFSGTIGELAWAETGSHSGRTGSDDGSDVENYLVQQSSTNANGGGGAHGSVDGDELFVFGSNKNMSLGVGDESDRQYPERINLRRPDHLFHRFYHEYLAEAGQDDIGAMGAAKRLDELPAMILTRPLEIHDVVLSKLHSAVLTTDPVSNLYICGVGRGGRLGMNDEEVRFSYAPVQGALADRRVTQLALGQDHSMAVTDMGELWTWGSNSWSQLGYTLPPPTRQDEEPMSLTPRQVFGPLKKETIIGVAASAIHSVAHTGTSLFCWGKNVGQLALMDADSRSLEVQQTPRKVAASLFPSSILMVSAIDKATTVLLSNHTVWVFTSYGYNMVKFPVIDLFANYNLGNSLAPVGRDSSGRTAHKISFIASGGETIAAVTSQGDLFIVGLNHNVDANSSASTTNPSKIKGAVGQPQCIWSARTDGVKSVGVGEHGSVIISTDSGAVWRRVKRATAKDAFANKAGHADTKRKLFKFQRVPYITKVVNVRSSAFGAFAAVRRDPLAMKERISVDEQTLWKNLEPLFSLCGFSSGRGTGEFHKEVVLSAMAENLDRDLASHLMNLDLTDEGYDTSICSSSDPKIKVPMHGWILTARSPVLRKCFAEYRARGSAAYQDLFSIDREEDGKAVVTFEGLEVATVLNIAAFLYRDEIAPFWSMNAPRPQLTQKHRQFRVELMRVAAKLGLADLERATRLQTSPYRHLGHDLRSAIQDPSFFEDGDAILELEGGELAAHSSLLCRRCPYFEGLFQGRSQGMWLATRRDALDRSGKVRIDLKHFGLEPFRYVLWFLYADIGEELFDTTASASLDDFTDLVMDALAIANELMLDRLSQVCQKVLARFVNTRSIAHLLNEISPCSITEFKMAGLEYICMQIETMLENHLLDDLEDDLLLELDGVVKANQTLCCPFTRGSHVKDRLHGENPDLGWDIQEERRIRVKEMAYRVSQRDEDRKLSSSFKGGRVGSLDDFASPLSMTTPDRTRRKPGRNEPFSPSLRPKASTADLMFDMDDEEEVLVSPLSKTRPESAQQRQQPSRDPQPAAASAQERPLLAGPGSSAPRTWRSQFEPPDVFTNPAKSSPSTVAKAGNPWQSTSLTSTPKLGLRDIMTEASSSSPAPASAAASNHQSALTAGLVAQKLKDATTTSSPKQAQQPKLSQKQKKQMKQAAALAAQESAVAATKAPAWESSPKAGEGPSPRPSPWKATPLAPRTSLRDALSGGGGGAPAAATPKPTTTLTPAPPAMPMAKPLVAAESSTKPAYRRTASPDTRFSGQSRTPAATTAPTSSPMPRAEPHASSSSLAAPPHRQQQHPQQQQPPLVPHSKSYIRPAPKAEPGPGGLLSMADIIGQQRLEQERSREAVAKRSLQEIQQEQAFQEWWDQESRRAQEEEARRVAREVGKARGKGKGKGAVAGVAAVGVEEAGGAAAGGDCGSGSGGSGGRGRGRRGGRGGGRVATRGPPGVGLTGDVGDGLAAEGTSGGGGGEDVARHIVGNNNNAGQRGRAKGRGGGRETNSARG